MFHAYDDCCMLIYETCLKAFEVSIRFNIRNVLLLKHTVITEFINYIPGYAYMDNFRCKISCSNTKFSSEKTVTTQQICGLKS